MPTKRRKTRPLLTATQLSVGARSLGAPMTYWSGDGPDLAHVREVGDHERPPVVDILKDTVDRKLADSWDVGDKDGVVFSLRRYEGADHPSYDVVVDDDRVAGTFFHEGGLIHQQVIVRDDASAPVAEIDTRRHVHRVEERHGAELAACRRTFDGPGNDPMGDVWSVDIERDSGALDRRVLIAAPLVCNLMVPQARRLDPDSTIATSLLIAIPPVGGVLLVAERMMDGLYWLRRKLD